MLPIRGIYEVAIPVKDLPRAEIFYREVLGLEVGLRDETRNWLFLRVGGQAGQSGGQAGGQSGGMLVLQENKGEWSPTHYAFTIIGFSIVVVDRRAVMGNGNGFGHCDSEQRGRSGCFRRRSRQS